MGLAKTLIHVLGIGPLFIYVGLQRDQLPDYMFQLLGVLGLLLLVYHSYRAFILLQENKSAWVNWIHIFLIAPLLLVLGYLKKDASRRYFEMMLMLGFSAIGYHGLYLIRDSMFE
jgi:succinate dehydrogenase hydrophobic anchor subunit